MASYYTHSNTFAQLKDIKEKIPGNLSSFQYINILDRMLWKGFSVLYKNYPDFTLSFVSKIVSLQYLSFSTRYVRTNVNKIPIHLFNLLVTKNENYLNEIELNRGLIFSLLKHYLEITSSYVQLQSIPFSVLDSDQESKLQFQLKSFLAVDDLSTVYPVHKEIQKHYEDATSFKSKITEKYIRLALNNANSSYRKFNHLISLDDVTQLYLVQLSRAIDRVNIHKGVLTTFIQQTLLTAYGTLKKQAQERFESSYDLAVEEGEVITYSEADESYEALQHLVSIAKKYDPEGIIRYELNLPEILSTEDIETLKLLEKR